MAEHKIPSVAVAVAQDGKIIWEEAFGFANREKRIPATPQTMYSLASISKPFTATGLMVLKERGRIDLDRPINDYLGESKVKVRVGNPAGVTVRRVATHSAGLPWHVNFFYHDEPYRAPTRDETIRRYANTVTEPGEKWVYSNLGYGILDYVIERQSGKRYARFLRDDVFRPLGLTRTSVDIEPGLEKYQAVRYDEDGAPIPFYGFDHAGASAVYSSAHDLVRFGMFHLKARLPDQQSILSDAGIDEMQKPVIQSIPNQWCTVGWYSTLYPDNRTAISHSGGMGGVATTLRLFPKEKIAIVVLTNSGNSQPGLIANQIIETLMPGGAPKPPPNTSPAPFKPAAGLMGIWSGKIHTYQAEIPLTLEIKPDGDIHAQIGNQMKTLLNWPDLTDGYLTGRMMGDLGTEDTTRMRHILYLSVKLRGNIMNGAVSAIAYGKRSGNTLSHWVELKKQ